MSTIIKPIAIDIPIETTVLLESSKLLDKLPFNV